MAIAYRHRQNGLVVEVTETRDGIVSFTDHAGRLYN